MDKTSKESLIKGLIYNWAIDKWKDAFSSNKKYFSYKYDHVHDRGNIKHNMLQPCNWGA